MTIEKVQSLPTLVQRQLLWALWPKGAQVFQGLFEVTRYRCRLTRTFKVVSSCGGSGAGILVNLQGLRVLRY